MFQASQLYKLGWIESDSQHNTRMCFAACNVEQHLGADLITTVHNEHNRSSDGVLPQSMIPHLSVLLQFVELKGKKQCLQGQNVRLV